MLRRFLAWMIVALLPVQGYAAASMISCGPMHAEMAAASSMASHAGGHQHDHAADGHDGASAHRHGDGDPSTFASLGKFKCSACASCCTGTAAPAPSPLSFAAPRVHGEQIPFHPASEATFVPDGLERPPRSLLA